jgi:type VI secretion system protein ImpC
MSSEAHDAPNNPDEATSGARNTDGAPAGNGSEGVPAPGASPPEVSLEAIAEDTRPSLVAEMMAASGLAEASEVFLEVDAGLRAFLGYALRGGHAEVIDPPGVDALIVELTGKMNGQIDEILHHPTFQRLEAAWRSLKFVIDRVDFRENIRVEILNVSKQDLLEDFQDSPEIPKSGLFRIIYSAEYGQFGGRPFGLIVANYEFSPLPQDMSLLDDCASVATMAHAPFVAAASPKFFGLDSWLTLPQLNELEALFSGPQYTKWRSFRDKEDARYVGLCLPRFLLRLPYGPATNRVAAFEYEETVVGQHERYLWGNAAFAFATRVAEAFARYRWCVNIIGPSTGGTVEELPLHEYEALGHIQTKIPTEIVVTERREFEVAREGFMPLVYRPDTGNACFLSANSCQRVKNYGISKDARKAEINHRLGTQLPYLFMSCRLAHYIKVLQRENIGTWKERQDLERELQGWINQYVASQAVATAALRARRPLRGAQIKVTEVAGNAGWYRVDMQIQPHFRHMGAEFHLGLVGRLDQE